MKIAKKSLEHTKYTLDNLATCFLTLKNQAIFSIKGVKIVFTKKSSKVRAFILRRYHILLVKRTFGTWVPKSY
jgi:hypothetical protein